MTDRASRTKSQTNRVSEPDSRAGKQTSVSKPQRPNPSTYHASARRCNLNSALETMTPRHLCYWLCGPPAVQRPLKAVGPRPRLRNRIVKATGHCVLPVTRLYSIFHSRSHCCVGWPDFIMCTSTFIALMSGRPCGAAACDDGAEPSSSRSLVPHRRRVDDER